MSDNGVCSCGGEIKALPPDSIGQVFYRCEKCGKQTNKPKVRFPTAAPALNEQQSPERKPAAVTGKVHKNCKRFRVPDSGCDNYDAIIEGIIRADELACESFLGKNDYEMDDYVVRIRQELVQVFEDNEPRYSLPLSRISSPAARKEMAKALGLDTETVDKVAAQILTEHPPGKKKQKQNNVKVVASRATEGEAVILEHLSLIEDPAVANLPVVVRAVVSSTSISYLIPQTVEVTITDKDGVEDQQTIEIGAKNPINIKFVGVNEEIKYRRLKRFVEEGVKAKYGSKIQLEEKKWRTIYKIRVRPPVFTLEKREGKLIDQAGYEYKGYDVYIVADKAIVFEASALVELTGVVLPNPRSQNTTLLVYDVNFPEEFTSFNGEKLDVLRNKFVIMPVQERVNWILRNFAKFSQIVGRENLAFEGFLTFFTPMYITFYGKTEKGWGNSASIGDTTVGKSETVKKQILLLRAGMLITAETASAVGLVGATVQSEKGQWAVEWGFLVLNDGKLLAVDGAHKLPFSQWAALAESERSGVVTIAKAAKNSAYARTRQIKIANAVDQEANKFATKTMKSFLYPVQAIATVFDKTGIARLDLAVFADARDVKAEEVNTKIESDYDEDLELLAEALRWCWSNNANIEFTSGASDQILKSATALYNKFFFDSIPLTTIDFKWKLIRMSAALAFMTVSTEDYQTVKVTEEHVGVVVAFLEGEYNRVGLNTLAAEGKYETVTAEDAQILIANIAYKTELDPEKVKSILKFIVLQGRVTKAQIMSEFDLPETNQFRPLMAILQNEKLVRGGRGYYSTSKLIETYKVLPRLPRLPPPGKDPPRNGLEKYVERETKKIDPSYPEDVKQGKQGKNGFAKPSIREVLEKIRSVFVEGTEKDWESLAVENGLSQQEAESLFERLKGKELFWFNRNERVLWKWTNE